MNKYLLTGYDFDEAGPFLLLDTTFDQSLKRKKFYLRDKSFTLKKADERFCIGGYDLDTQKFLFCPNKAKPEEGKFLCKYCRQKSGFNPAFYNASVLSPKQEAYNKRPHVAYLANFGIGLTKVGIASRTPTRWLEQGARAVLVIKNCENAYEARKIEEETRKELAIPESINSNLKRRILIKEFDNLRAEKELLDIRDRVIDIGIKAEENNVLFLDQFYLGNSQINPNTIDLTKDSDFLSGKFVGLVGDILICSQGFDNFMISLKKFISYIVEIDNKIITLTTNSQPSLGI